MTQDRKQHDYVVPNPRCPEHLVRVTFTEAHPAADYWFGEAVDARGPEHGRVFGNILVDESWVVIAQPEAFPERKGYGAAFYYAAALLAGDLGKSGVRPDSETLSDEARALWLSFVRRGVARFPEGLAPEQDLERARLLVLDVRNALLALGCRAAR